MSCVAVEGFCARVGGMSGIIPARCCRAIQPNFLAASRPGFTVRSPKVAQMSRPASSFARNRGVRTQLLA